MIKPKKLDRGDHVRVIAPVRSMSLIGQERKDYATSVLEKEGLDVSFGRHIDECDEFNSSSIHSRVEDLHDAFLDKSVDAILTVIGGYNANQLLEYIDYDLIRKNPKILCGYSDVTVLNNAILAKTGLITYSGPHFSSFSMEKGFGYTLEHFRRCFFLEDEYEVSISEQWSDDAWYLDQENRCFIDNSGPIIFNGEGENVSGRVIGGNIGCFQALQGTQFFPDIENSVLFLEADEEISPEIFDRHLQSLIHHEDFVNVKALLIGRFPIKCGMDNHKLESILKTKEKLNFIPTAYNLDFGHTTPIFTFPVGGTVTVSFNTKKLKVKFIEF